MQRITQYILFSCIMMLVSFSTNADESSKNRDDSIAINYVGGYPLPLNSLESINLNIKRFHIDKSDTEIDKFFNQISTILTENRVNKDWQLAVPDAPSISIIITINGKKISLNSCHTIMERNGKLLMTEKAGYPIKTSQERASLLAAQSERFRQHRIALEKILSLSVERANTQFLNAKLN